MTRDSVSRWVGVAALAGLTLQGGPAVAQDRWLTIAENESETRSFDSRSVVQVDSGAYQAWVRTEFTKLQRRSDGQSFQSQLERLQFDCLGKRLGVMEVVAYDSEGQVVSSAKASVPSWHSVVPASIGESKWEAVCAFGASFAGGVPPTARSEDGSNPTSR